MAYRDQMTRTDEKVGDAPAGKVDRTAPDRPAIDRNGQPYTPDSAAMDVEAALRVLDGRWKLSILFHLFGGKVLRFSDLERAIPAISQKMLAQQLRQLETDGMVQRTVFPEVPPRVEYCLTAWGEAVCPALDAVLQWANQRPDTPEAR